MENQTTQEEQKIPTKDELIAFLQEQIDVKKVQLELQELNTKLAEFRVSELKALSFISQITNPKAADNSYQGGVPHILTKEDMEMNPELAEEGLKEGDTVMLPKEAVNDQITDAVTNSKKSKSLKK
jgi:hypothetical protein